MKRRWPYLVAAVVLLGLGAYLTSAGDPPKLETHPVEMPLHQTVREKQRVEQRRTLPPPAAAAPAAVLPEQPPRPRDPVLVAMPAEVKRVAMVVEANALRNSDLGDALVACMMADSPGSLDEVRDAGFDPLTQLDRVSIFDDTVMMTGDFGALKIPEQPAGTYGGAQLYQHNSDDGVLAVWKGQALLSGPRDDVQAAVDRLEGRGGDDPPVLGESKAFGEVYGVLKPDAVAKLFDGVDPRLAEFMKGAAQSVELHVDAMHDVGVAADIKGGDTGQVEELRRMLGGAIAAARARAAAEGHPAAAEVLDQSRVRPAADGRFLLELGVPYDLLKGQLDKCVARGKERAAARSVLDAGP